jgi:hypothetical protein
VERNENDRKDEETREIKRIGRKKVGEKRKERTRHGGAKGKERMVGRGKKEKVTKGKGPEKEKNQRK